MNINTNFLNLTQNLNAGQINKTVAGQNETTDISKIFNTADNNGEAKVYSLSDLDEFETSDVPVIDEATLNNLDAQISQITNGVTGTSSVTSASAANAEVEKIQKEIEAKEAEKKANEEKMEKLEKQIEKAADEAKEQVKKAKSLQEKAIDQHEEEVDKALKHEMNKYIEANKNGEGMSRDELSKNIKDAIPGAPDLADAVACLAAASEYVDEIDDCLGDLKCLINANKNIDTEIAGLSKAKASAEEQAKKCCDPIGFTTEDGSKYDFIVDDGDFDSVNDFLGADNQWEAMQALDTDGNGTVDSNELKAGNIKAVKTDADGNKQVVDLAEEFGDDISIDLSTFDKNGTNANINAADDDGDGVANQSLEGTFKINIGNKEYDGYDTLDDTEWLANEYGLSTGATEEAENVPASSNRLNASEYSEELQAHVNFFNTYSEISENLRAEIEDGYEQNGLTKDEAVQINDSAKTQGNADAQKFQNENNIDDDGNNIDELEEAEEAEKAEEEKEEEEEEEKLAA